MSIFTLSLLFMSFAQDGEYKVIAARAPIVAMAAQDAVAFVGPVFEDDEDGSKTEMLLMRMAYLESRGDHTLVHPKDGAAGIVQVVGLYGDARERVLASAYEGFVEGLKKLKNAKGQCGGPAIRWIGGYASGKCGGAPSVSRERCHVVGLCNAR